MNKGNVLPFEGPETDATGALTQLLESGAQQMLQLAIEDGRRESMRSWREVLLKLQQRGMNAPKLGIGDGALGFWAASG